MDKEIRFVDLFAGIGGIRLGLEQAAKELGYEPKCVLTSEIKEYAIDVLKQNHPDLNNAGDITNLQSSDIPDFEILCAGFPCQAFSSAGNRYGFADTRGTLFFEIARILKEKQPKGFILENVEGLANHDGGKTLAVILGCLKELQYKVSYAILNSADFGVPQNRKRIYIVGTKSKEVLLKDFEKTHRSLNDILDENQPTTNTKFTQALLRNYAPEQLYGKAIKDKRGGDSNIHSWDLEIKGRVSKKEREFLNMLLKQRRKKKWAEEIGIDWMDGMPLTEKQIQTFYQEKGLKNMLDKLVGQGYLKLEHPKKLVKEKVNGLVKTYRVPDTTKEMGYNIVAGKLSFEFDKILDPNDVAPTLVAMDMAKLGVLDNGGIRRLSLREGLRLFGYPEDFRMDVASDKGYDLLGNTVVVPVIKSVSLKLIKTLAQ